MVCLDHVMTNNRICTYFFLIFFVSSAGCVTPHRDFNVSLAKKCDSVSDEIVMLNFQNTTSHTWNEWERQEFLKFIKGIACVDVKENNNQKGLKITFKKNDTSPALTTFETVTGVISVVTLFLFPSKREMSETIEMEVQNLNNGRTQKFESGYNYTKFTHILLLPAMYFRDNEADYDKKILVELLIKARSEGYKL